MASIVVSTIAFFVFSFFINAALALSYAVAWLVDKLV